MTPEDAAASACSDAGTLETLRRPLTHRSEALLLCALACLSALLFVASESAWYGDATTYAADIRAGRLSDPGHLLWRPLASLVHLAAGAHSYSAVLWQLQFLCLVASVLAVLAMYRLAAGLYGWLPGVVVAVLMAVSNGFWIYAFSGCSYSLSMLFAILALRCAIAPRDTAPTARAAFAAGVLGGLAAASWTIQVLAAPAIWVALVLTPARPRTVLRQHLRNSAALGAGYVLTFVIPMLAAYLAQARGYTLASAATTGNSLTFFGWLASSRHGIPAHYGLAQLLRVVIGWPQSVISTSDLGAHLRLWRLQEAAFPASGWLGVFVLFYAAVGAAIWALARAWPRLDTRDRGVIASCATALGTNLLFAASWQGTDLERYFPSWPFQLLLLALLLRLAAAAYPPRRLTAAVCAAVVSIAVLNGIGTLAAVLAPDSYRQVWLRELRRATSPGDLVILFGQRTQGIMSPHDPQLPKIDNVSLEIEVRGSGWRAAELRSIEAARQRGGRIFLADTLFGTDQGPRDGWSFREYPRPTPEELEEAFLPFKSERVGFVVGTEKVWLGKD
jgi:hypothetical protein